MALSARAKRKFASNKTTAAAVRKIKGVGADKLLTPHEQAFVTEYVKTQSAIAAFKVAYPTAVLRAGPQALAMRGQEVFKRPHVQRAIEMFEQAKVEQIREEERERLIARHGRLGERVVTERRVVEELHDLAFANIKDFLTFDDQGHPQWNFQHASDRQMASIAEIDMLVKNGANGQPEIRVKVKFHNKLVALKMLGEHLNVWPKDGGFVMPTGAGQSAETKSNAADSRARLLQFLDQMAVPEPLTPAQIAEPAVRLPSEPSGADATADDGEGADLFPR